MTLGTNVWLARPAHAQSAHAQPAATPRFDIPAGPLGEALAAFARQANVSLIYSAETLAHAHSDGLHGQHDIDAGLSLLLAATGQSAQRVAGGIRIAPRPEPGVSTLAPVRVTAPALFEAQSEGTMSYSARAATIGKTALALKDLPQSVSVVTRQRLDDQNLRSLAEVLENTTGVTLSEVADGGRNYFSRGFRIGNVQYDGVPLSRSFYAVGNSFTGNTAYLDRVEVFRGAQGLFEGAGTPGGSINLVRKRADVERQVLLEARAGSWDHAGAMIDAGGALDADGRLRMRAVLDYDDEGSFVDLTNARNTNAYLAVDADTGADTTMGLGVLMSRLRSRPFFGGLPRYSDGGALGLERSTFLGAVWNRWDRDETQVFADLTHRLNADWQFKVSATHVHETSVTTALDATGAVDRDTGMGPMRTAWDYDKSARHVGVDAHIDGRFSVFDMPQALLVGASFSRLRSQDRIAYAFNYRPLDVFNPDPYLPPPASFPDSQRLSRYEPLVQKGIYAQLRSHLTPDLTLVTGGRFSWFESTFTTQAQTWDSVSRSNARAEFTPSAGILYALTPQWNVYASYAEIFEPQTATTRNGAVLAPIVGANYEAGIKGELFSGRLNAAFALYRIDQENRAVEDRDVGPICNGQYCQRAAGRVRSQGVEAEVSGEVLSGWQVAAGYAYNHNRFLRDPDRQGEVFSEETPRHLLRLWTDYRLPGAWQRVSVGVGVNWQSAVTNTTSGVRRSAYGVWNARLAYALTPRWSAAVNIDNLFDKVYDQTAGFLENRNNYGAPRRVLVTLRGRF